MPGSRVSWKITTGRVAYLPGVYAYIFLKLDPKFDCALNSFKTCAAVHLLGRSGGLLANRNFALVGTGDIQLSFFRT